MEQTSTRCTRPSFLAFRISSRAFFRFSFSLVSPERVLRRAGVTYGFRTINSSSSDDDDGIVPVTIIQKLIHSKQKTMDLITQV